MEKNHKKSLVVEAESYGNQWKNKCKKLVEYKDPLEKVVVDIEHCSERRRKFMKTY